MLFENKYDSHESGNVITLEQTDFNDAVDLPHSDFINSADLSREGSDLILELEDGSTLTIEGYFSIHPTPALAGPEGQQLSPKLVNSFLKGGEDYAQGQTLSDASPIGSIQELDGAATVTRVDGTVDTVTLGTPIYTGDIVETLNGGAVKLGFLDDSTISLSNNARMVVDEYVFDPNSESGETEVSILRGIFMFTSGLIGRDDPDDVTIETPKGSIGIRGTVIAGNVDSGEITVLEGAIVLRSFDGSEITLASQLETARFTPENGGIELQGRLSTEEFGARFDSIRNVDGDIFISVDRGGTPVEKDTKNQAPENDGEQPNKAGPEGEQPAQEGASPQDAPPPKGEQPLAEGDPPFIQGEQTLQEGNPFADPFQGDLINPDGPQGPRVQVQKTNPDAKPLEASNGADRQPVDRAAEEPVLDPTSNQNTNTGGGGGGNNSGNNNNTNFIDVRHDETLTTLTLDKPIIAERHSMSLNANSTATTNTVFEVTANFDRLALRAFDGTDSLEINNTQDAFFVTHRTTPPNVPVASLGLQGVESMVVENSGDTTVRVSLAKGSAGQNLFTFLSGSTFDIITDANAGDTLHVSLDISEYEADDITGYVDSIGGTDESITITDLGKASTIKIASEDMSPSQFTTEYISLNLNSQDSVEQGFSRIENTTGSTTLTTLVNDRDFIDDEFNDQITIDYTAGPSSTGEVRIFRGNTNGPSGDGTVDHIIQGEAGPDFNRHIISAEVIGDFDGDGIDNLAIVFQDFNISTGEYEDFIDLYILNTIQSGMSTLDRDYLDDLDATFHGQYRLSNHDKKAAADINIDDRGDLDKDGFDDFNLLVDKEDVTFTIFGRETFGTEIEQLPSATSTPFDITTTGSDPARALVGDSDDNMYTLIDPTNVSRLSLKTAGGDDTVRIKNTTGGTLEVNIDLEMQDDISAGGNNEDTLIVEGDGNEVNFHSSGNVDLSNINTIALDTGASEVTATFHLDQIFELIDDIDSLTIKNINGVTNTLKLIVDGSFADLYTGTGTLGSDDTLFETGGTDPGADDTLDRITNFAELLDVYLDGTNNNDVTYLGVNADLTAHEFSLDGVTPSLTIDNHFFEMDGRLLIDNGV
jgi:hypothetical protein